MKAAEFLAIILAGRCATAAPVLRGIVSRAPMPMPIPPGIPADSTAQSLLAGLAIRSSGDAPGYDRDLFPLWDTITGSCNAREYVLKRDGVDVVVNSACAATAGTWVSPYDGATWTKAEDIDIDHMVPLKNAWVSGASSWTTSKRKQFANDVVRPQLWAVTDDVNQAKGDKSPDQWRPPLTSFYCTYAKSWIQVKSYWALSITSAEKTALSSMIGQCGSQVQSPPPPSAAARHGQVGDVKYVAVLAGLLLWL